MGLRQPLTNCWVLKGPPQFHHGQGAWDKTSPATCQVPFYPIPTSAQVVHGGVASWNVPDARVRTAASLPSGGSHLMRQAKKLGGNETMLPSATSHSY